MTAVEFANFDESLSIIKGNVDPEGTAVYSVVRNEMYFLPAFLEHYRQLGVQQFLFLDDKSDDGTREYLLAQPDCAVAQSSRRYGEQIAGWRQHIIWKNQIPHQFLPGRWAICADADEFLFLPPALPTVDALVEVLEWRGTTAVSGVMVDFYPATLADMEALGAPRDRSELFAAYPWFDAGPYFHWWGGELLPAAPYGGVRARLLRKYGISRRKKPKSWIKRLRIAIRGGVPNGPWIAKVPLVKWLPNRIYRNSHSLNIAPDVTIMLPIVHFKMTSDLHKRVFAAIESRSHVKGSQEYFELADLLEVMKMTGGNFIDECSIRFTDVKDLEENGLMKINL